MNHKSKSSRQDPLPGKSSAFKTTSSRRRFLKQTLAAGVAGVGVRGAQGQDQTPATKRAKPHKSPANKKDHTKKLPKDLKESMEWDFERFVSEVIEQILQGKKTKEIEAWIYTKEISVDKRQIVETEVEDDSTGSKKKHPLGVCMDAPIEWKMDGDEIAGFIIRGRQGRQLTGEPMECSDYQMGNSTASRAPAAGALVFASRLPRAQTEQRLVATPAASSSSSSSSSSWPKP
jgi:hypothetical protein